jgi:hypothetical protein
VLGIFKVSLGLFRSDLCVDFFVLGYLIICYDNPPSIVSYILRADEFGVPRDQYP